MNFLSDENFPQLSSQLLATNGHHVRLASAMLQGMPDIKLLKEAVEKEEILLTFDKDFGELIFRENLPNPPGIILFRLRSYLPEDPALIILETLQQNILSFPGFFTVIDKDKVRQKKFLEQP
jgi:predicted nuclease of predicted toxin-antitoxin system